MSEKNEEVLIDIEETPEIEKLDFIDGPNFDDENRVSELPDPMDSDEDIVVHESETEKSEGSSAFWTLEFYQQYFQTDQVDVFTRILRCFFPKDGFLSLKVDLWGFFWVLSTYFIMVVITSNFMGLMHYSAILKNEKEITKDSGVPSNIEEWTADFTTVSIGVFILYGYCALMSIAHWLLFKWINAPITLGSVLSLYGYSFAVMIPFTLLCITTYDILRWFAVGCAFLYQSAILCIQLLKEVRKYVSGANQVHIITSIVLVLGPQVILFLIIKIFYYSTWFRTVIIKN